MKEKWGEKLVNYDTGNCGKRGRRRLQTVEQEHDGTEQKNNVK